MPGDNLEKNLQSAPAPHTSVLELSEQEISQRIRALRESGPRPEKELITEFGAGDLSGLIKILDDRGIPLDFSNPGHIGIQEFKLNPTIPPKPTKNIRTTQTERTTKGHTSRITPGGVIREEHRIGHAGILTTYEKKTYKECAQDLFILLNRIFPGGEFSVGEFMKNPQIVKLVENFPFISGGGKKNIANRSALNRRQYLNYLIRENYLGLQKIDQKKEFFSKQWRSIEHIKLDIIKQES